MKADESLVGLLDCRAFVSSSDSVEGEVEMGSFLYYDWRIDGRETGIA